MKEIERESDESKLTGGGGERGVDVDVGVGAEVVVCVGVEGGEAAGKRFGVRSSVGVSSVLRLREDLAEADLSEGSAFCTSSASGSQAQ